MVARDQQVIHSGLFPLRAPSRARTFIFAGCKYSPHPSAAPRRPPPIRKNMRMNCSGFQGLYLQTLSKRTYLFVEYADALYAEYAAQGVEFTRGLGNMSWHSASSW